MKQIGYLEKGLHVSNDVHRNLSWSWEKKYHDDYRIFSNVEKASLSRSYGGILVRVKQQNDLDVVNVTASPKALFLTGLRMMHQ